MNENTVWQLYFPAKAILYLALVRWGFRALNPTRAVGALRIHSLAILRLLLGLLVAFPLGIAGLFLFSVLGSGSGAAVLTYLLLYPATRWIEWGTVEYFIGSDAWSLIVPRDMAFQWRAWCVVLTSIPDVALLSLGPYGPFRMHMC